MTLVQKDERQAKGKGEEHMNQKLLFFDIDGTLIEDGTGWIPDSTRKAVKMAQEAGHLLFINTGRTRVAIPEKIKQMGFDGYVCGCGTDIFLGDKDLLSSRIPHQLCCEVVRKVRGYQIPVFYEAAEAIYFDSQVQDAEGWVEHARKIFRIEGRDIEEVLRDEEKVYDKFLLILEPTERNLELKEYLSRYFLCIDRTQNVYEVVQKEHSKGTGIRFLCDCLGRSIEDCYAFGDSENDRPMLEAVPHSIAMGNGEEAIKKSCSYVTGSVREDGIYQAMKYFKIIR